uniref:NAD kinase 2, mitochondrial n=1 Tax=Acartia pacifica TaxID=335913 RepID=A0A0U2T6A2_ACAPC|nr:mitochondrial NAD kinase-like protein [Acartia pacifica]
MSSLKQIIRPLLHARAATELLAGGGGGGLGCSHAGSWTWTRHMSMASMKNWDPAQFKPRKAVILTKVSRYEYEKIQNEKMSERQLEEMLTKRGSDYTMIRYHHNVHKALEQEVVHGLEGAGMEVKVVKRYQYNDEVVKWADLIVTTGGDGTFLMGSSKILNRNKPILGINTDPTRSEGHLCLPKHYSFNIQEAIDAIFRGKFKWFFRRRLRVTLIGLKEKINEAPVELHDQQLQYPEYRYMDLMTENADAGDHPFKEPIARENTAQQHTRILPVFGLNEIYIGESLSSRVSYLELQIDKEPAFKTRNSGLCIATGTGSTSWTFNINKLTHHAVESLLKIIYETTKYSLNWKDPKLVEAITQKFNNQLVFDPEADVMCYTLRDAISVGTFPTAKENRPRGTAKRMIVKSKCFDACLVIDGSLSFKFNDGAKAIIDILEEDALRTFQLYSEL